jgi:hypothetical protein
MAHPFSPGKLSLELEQLQRRVEGRSLTVSELEQLLKGRGAALLLILLALPFCFIAIPGLSTPFGIAIGLIGLSLLIGRDPRLPGFITQRRLPAARLAQILSCSISVARQLEKFARPRFAILYDGPVRLRLIGLGNRSGQRRIDAAVADPFLEQHSGVGSRPVDRRNAGEGWLVRFTGPSNRCGFLGVYWRNFNIRGWISPENFGALSSPIIVGPASLALLDFCYQKASRADASGRDAVVIFQICQRFPKLTGNKRSKRLPRPEGSGCTLKAGGLT